MGKLLLYFSNFLVSMLDILGFNFFIICFCFVVVVVVLAVHTNARVITRKQQS